MRAAHPMTDSPWQPIAIPAVRDPLATPFGFVLDHIWRAPGTNDARRPHWPEDMFISVLPCIDLDPPNEFSDGATHWVFFENGLEYVPTDKPRPQLETIADLIWLAEAEVTPSPLDDIVPDLLADDWLVGEVE